LIFYVDNGPPGSGADLASPLYAGPPDPAGWPAGFPYVCPSPDTGVPALGIFRSFIPISRGDIVVQDTNAAPSSDSTQVAVSHGQPVEIALAEDQTGSASSFTPGVANAVRMAVDAHPTIHGFPIQINAVNAPCGGDPAADVAAAKSIAANLQNVGVLGQLCSGGFDQALPVYETAGLVTISGSATSDALPSFGPTVFDRTAVNDAGGFDAWYATVSQLPSDLQWRQAYTLRFGTAPTDFADLYYDAAGLLIRNLDSVSTVDHGSLVVNRAALAGAVRGTTNYKGVTCTVTLDPATGNRLNDPAALARCGAN
jgi:ABC-type branched-subunit amino acid transport system substrate-binding protein